MNIRLLGTGGADGIPGFYSNSDVSQYARKHGGKDFRTRCAALVDGQLKIDLPPDTLCQLQRDGLDARDWSALLFTHSHEDHFAVAELQYTLYPFTELEEIPFTVYGNQQIGKGIRERYPEWPIDFTELRAECTYIHATYAITPIRAMHKEDEECLNLLIECGDERLLYATDTGIWDDATFAFLADYPLNCLVIECTEGFRRTEYKGHLNFDDLELVLRRLRTSGVVSPQTRVVTTHHAATGGATHARLQEVLKPMGAEPGYDGMLIEF